MKKLLWLDDLRNPFLNIENRLPDGDWFDIVWVRSYKEFSYWLTHNKLPHAISFDHDLHPEHYTSEYFWNDYEASKKFQEWRSPSYKEKTGEDCAKLLKNYCDISHLNLPMCYVHSANPVGADKIKLILNLD